MRIGLVAIIADFDDNYWSSKVQTTYAYRAAIVSRYNMKGDPAQQ